MVNGYPIAISPRRLDHLPLTAFAQPCHAAEWTYSLLAARNKHQMPLGRQSGNLQRLHLCYLPAGRQTNDFIIGLEAFHGYEPAAGSQQMCRPVDEIGQVGKGPRSDYIKRRFNP